MADLGVDDAVMVREPCHQDLVIPVSKHVSGPAGQQADVEWTIHGFVLDQHKRFVPGVTVRLRDRGASTTSDSTGYYRLSFRSPGFTPVSIRLDLTLQAACVEVEPRLLTLRPVAPGGRVTARAALTNTCTDRAVEVRIDRRAGSSDRIDAGIVDCDAGTADSLSRPSPRKAVLGPGARCVVEARFEPMAAGMAQAVFEVIGDDLARCTIPFEVQGVACSMVRIDRQAVEFLAARKRQLYSERLTLSNASPHSPLTIPRVEVTGRDASCFMARLGQVQGGAISPVGTSASLMPGGRADVIVDLGAPDSGIKRAILVIHTSDPDAPQLEIPLSALVD
jgi:hypothetical protein